MAIAPLEVAPVTAHVTCVDSGEPVSRKRHFTVVVEVEFSDQESRQASHATA